MGGRGSSSGISKGSGISAASKSAGSPKAKSVTAPAAKSGGESLSATDIMAMDTKFTTKEISAMSRSALETVATAVFVKQNVARGLAPAEAKRRAQLLLNGNSSAQLRKFIKKHG